MMRHAALVLLGLMLFVLPLAAQEDLPQLIARIQPSVVTIIIFDPSGKVIGNGSGFFISPKGHLVTSYHVLSRAARAEIKTHDGQRYPIKMVLAADPRTDLIKVTVALPADPPAYLPISSKRPMVGERVVVIGSPLGLDQTVSDGMVSGIRLLQGVGEVLQISAPISPGSSGGPVVNLKGEVLGMARGFLTRGQNLNFAIPGSLILALREDSPKPLEDLAKESRAPAPGLPSPATGLPPRPTIHLPPKQSEP
jgi:serine protease Do